MKKMFLASCLLAASVFAAPEVKPAETAPVAPATPAATEATPAAEVKAELAAPVAEVKEEVKPAEQVAAPTSPAPEAKPAEAASPVAEVKADSVATPAPVAEAKADSTAPVASEVPVASADSASAPAVQPAETAQADSAVVESAPVAEVKADSATPVQESVAEAKVDSATVPAPVVEAKPEEKVAVAPAQKPAKKKRKKKKLVENAIVETQQIAFDVQADFELEAGKVFWSGEDDEMSDNLETWNGEANLAVLAETENFKGKIAVAFYPGDLQMADENIDKKAKRAILRSGEYAGIGDYFSLDEAWAMQDNEHFSFKLGRWDNTDKNGDYFGGYVDGYLNGFMSTQPSENQLQFGFTPSENLDFTLSLISGSPNLDKGDIRAAFNFHGLESLADLKVQLAYRSNLFDKVYDTDVDVQHNGSLKANLPIIKNRISVFGEFALLNIDPNDDMVLPLTGGFAFETPVVDRIIIEAEYISDRHEKKGFVSPNAKHVKDVLGAIYIEKAFNDRFSLSAGFHSFGTTKDYMLSGNLVGRIN